MNQKSELKNQLPEYMPQIRRVVANIARNEDYVDDIAQECCVRIIEKEALWDGNQGKLKQWINRVTRNLTINLVKQKRKEAARYQETEIETLEVPQSSQLQEDHIRWIMTQLKALPPMQKKVVQLKYFDGMNSTQIAKELNISQQTVFTHLNRALRSFKKRARTHELLAFILPWNWDLKFFHPSYWVPKATSGSHLTGSLLKTKTAVAVSCVAAGAWVTYEMRPESFHELVGSRDFTLMNAVQVSDEKTGQDSVTQRPTLNLGTPQDDLKTLNQSKISAFQALPDNSLHRVEKNYYTSGELKSEIPYFKEKIHGNKLDYFIDGHLMSKTPYTAGEINGKQVVYFRNGKIRSEVNYVRGKQEGVQKMFYPSGNIQFEWPHVNDHAHGTKVAYYPSGKKQLETSFLDGLEHGTKVFYFEEGAVKSKKEFFEGQLHGVSLTYNNSEALIKEEVYEKGKKNGVSRIFFPSGHPKSVSQYSQGKLMGETINYYESGEIKSIHSYQDSLLNGKQMNFYPSGKLKSETPYREGVIDGIQWIYEETGKIKEKKVYHQNQLVPAN